jgi:acetyltransferase-like isoleucine patch superfamily enzyme
LPLRAPALLALAVHRYGRWLKTARLARPAKIPLVVLHLALFEIVRHATGVFLQPWVDVEERVWFGSFAPILIFGGVTIGDRAVVGAGAVVLDDLAGGTTSVGNPARTVSKVGSDDLIYLGEGEPLKTGFDVLSRGG